MFSEDWLCPGTAITLLSVHEGDQTWKCDRCGREFVITESMLTVYSPRMYVHVRQMPLIPEAFYRAFEDDE